MREILKYWLSVVNHIYLNIVNSPIVINVYAFIIGALSTMWAGVGGLFFSVLFLLIVDVILGTLASIKSGYSFKSDILKKGLLEKFVLYGLLFIVAYVMESIIKTSLSYTNFYLVGLVASMIGFYECSSIVEKLMIIYPNNSILIRLSKWLNIWDKKIDQKAENLIK